MPNKRSVPESLVLRELAQIKALADPLRQRLLRAFAGEARTTKQVAHHLGENPTKLYHHVDTLAAAGLLKLVESRQNRGTVERYYRAAARQFAVDRHVFRHLTRARGSFSGAHKFFETAFDNALREIRRGSAKADATGKIALIQGGICATPAEAVALRTKIQRLVEGSTSRTPARRAKGSSENFEVMVAIYPVRSRRRPKLRVRHSA